MENRPLRRSVAPARGIGLKSLAFFAFISLTVAGASLGALKYSGLEAQAAQQPPSSAPAAPPPRETAVPTPPAPPKPTALVVGDAPPAHAGPTVIELDEPGADTAKPGPKVKPATAPKRVAPVRRPSVNPRTGLPVNRAAAPPTASASEPAAPVTAPPPPNPYDEGSPADARL